MVSVFSHFGKGDLFPKWKNRKKAVFILKKGGEGQVKEEAKLGGKPAGPALASWPFGGGKEEMKKGAGGLRRGGGIFEALRIYIYIWTNEACPPLCPRERVEGLKG